jgi:hydroxymethylpyrimidine pyrophosphatase-like HAD family hydrolase
MGNSTEELKSIADYVADDIDDNGVAGALAALGIL